MGKALNISTALVALVGIAPWAVFLGGLAKLTDVLTSFNFSQAVKQTVIMLEWYIVAAQFFNLIIILLVVFAGGLRRAHSLLNMFLAVNTTLLILRATSRIYQINRYRDGEDAAALLGVKTLTGNPLPYLRALAAGEVATATWNFFLAILIGFSGTDETPEEAAAAAQEHGKPGANKASAAPMTA